MICKTCLGEGRVRASSRPVFVECPECKCVGHDFRCDHCSYHDASRSSVMMVGICDIHVGLNYRQRLSLCRECQDKLVIAIKAVLGAPRPEFQIPDTKGPRNLLV